MTEGERRIGETCPVHGGAMPCEACREIADRLARAEAMETDHVQRIEGPDRLAKLGCALEDLTGKRVLELGFGHGELLRYLQHHDIDAVGIDREVPTRAHVLAPYYAYLAARDAGMSDEEISINLDAVPEDLQQHLPAQQPFVPDGAAQASWRAMPFGDHSMDVILGTALPSGVLDRDALAELRRVLKPGGVIRLHVRADRGEETSRALQHAMGGDWTVHLRETPTDDTVILEIHAPTSESV